MICLMCNRAEPDLGTTTVVLERGEFLLTIRHVPALVCPICGEAYTDETIAQHLLSMAKQMEDAGVMVDIREYKPG
jgi:YgiT-type zinc finger domain-containing protein